MSRQFQQLLGLLQSANAQTQLLATMIAEERERENEGDAHEDPQPADFQTRALPEPPVWVTKDGKEWKLTLSPEEEERVRSIERQMGYRNGHFIASEIVLRGLDSVEKELKFGGGIRMTEGNAYPPPEKRFLIE